MNIKLLLSFSTYFLTSVGLTYLFTLFYTWLTPGDEIKEINEHGNIGPAITLSATLFGFSLPLMSASLHGVNFLDFIIWGVVAGGLQIVLFYIFTVAIISKQTWLDIMSDKNIGATLVYAALAVIIGAFNAVSLIP